MAKSIGAVRFKNGDLLYLLWNHVVDNAFPRLFATREDAENAWDVQQGRNVYELTHCPGGDEVELTKWYGPGEFKASFRTRVNRQNMVIVGPLNLEQSWEEFGESSCSSSSPKTNFTRLRLALFAGGRSARMLR